MVHQTESLAKAPRAVLLDFDGVVVDSLGVHLEAWRDATVTVFKVPLPDPESLMGHATRTIAGIIAHRLGDPSLAGALAAAKQHLVRERYDRIGLLPGVRAFLAALRDRGIPHGIASNSPRAFVGGALAHLGLAVPAVVCGDEVSRGKPHPAIFWDCANRLGVPATERAGVCVYEDSAHGLHAAKSAGMIPLGVGTGPTAERLRKAGAVALCASLADALERGWLDLNAIA